MRQKQQKREELEKSMAKTRDTPPIISDIDFSRFSPSVFYRLFGEIVDLSLFAIAVVFGMFVFILLFRADSPTFVYVLNQVAPEKTQLAIANFMGVKWLFPDLHGEEGEGEAEEEDFSTFFAIIDFIFRTIFGMFLPHVPSITGLLEVSFPYVLAGFKFLNKLMTLGSDDDIPYYPTGITLYLVVRLLSHATLICLPYLLLFGFFLRRGTTPGKWLMGIRCVDKNLKAISTKGMIFREVVYKRMLLRGMFLETAASFLGLRSKVYSNFGDYLIGCHVVSLRKLAQYKRTPDQGNMAMQGRRVNTAAEASQYPGQPLQVVMR
mmetsp:Transcript_13417/g.35196  ORF Transcript_13417/g.35196 Transcript_13417/m.35196 type:complete len:321 (-) Transcript_13417:381-1343(-)